MSKKEVPPIQWLEMKTLKRLLATPPDHETKAKPRASRNRRGMPPQNARPKTTTPRRTGREKK
jgi:hypothetical protein